MPPSKPRARKSRAAKRSHGTGSLIRRGEKWAIRYRTPGGRQAWETIGPDKEAAELALAERLVSLKKGELAAEQSAFTFRQTASDWIREIERSSYEETTIQGWTAIARCHLIPALGSMLISRVELTTLIEYLQAKRRGADSDGRVLPVAGKAEPGAILSAATVRQHITVLGMIWDFAVLHKRATHNTAREIPRSVRKQLHRDLTRDQKIKVIEPADVKRLIKTTEGQDRRMIQTLVSTGIRLGELLALKVSDLDFETGILHIQRTIKGTGGYTLGDEGKTPSATRWIPLGEGMIKILREQARGKSAGDLLFSTDSETIINPNNWRNRVWKPACTRIGLKATPHHLRHTFASEQIVRRGREAYEVSRIMGHKDASITLRVYTHLFDEAQARRSAKPADTLDAYS